MTAEHPAGTGTVATVVAIDCYRTIFEAVKHAALQLDQLLRSNFAGDTLHMVTYSAYANLVERERLRSLNWDESVLGNNMQHALILAKEILDQETAGTRQIYVLSSGDVSAHLERGRSYFAYPPTLETIRRTSEAVRDCIQAGINVTIFVVQPALFAQTALMWSLDVDPETMKRVYVVPSSPTNLANDITLRYWLLKNPDAW